MSAIVTKSSTIAVATATVSIELTQPWSGDCPLDQVRKQAIDDATDHLRRAASDLAKHGIRIGEVRSIRIVINEDKVNA